EGMLLVHRGDIVEPVEIRDRLQIGLGFDQLLGAAMQQPDMRIDALHHLAVEFQHQAQHAVRRRVLRPEIDGEVAQLRFSHASDLAARARCGWGIADPMPSQPPFPLPAFSSPGRTYCGPSQGERKSKLRNSCASRTGSYTTRFCSSS